MKEVYLTTLRQSATPAAAFRSAANALSRLLAAEAACLIPTQSVQVQTPLATTLGTRWTHRVVLAAILRSGLAMLTPFQELFPNAPIGFFGVRRDEKTAAPRLYYQNLPKITREDWIFLIDPMLATGGSASTALKILAGAGGSLAQTALISIIAARPGVDAIQQKFPGVRILAGATDPGLNDRKFIVPGLGDFGDRYFDTVV